MKFLVVTVVFTIVLGHSFNKGTDVSLVQIAFLFVFKVVPRSPSTHRGEYNLLNLITKNVFALYYNVFV